MRSVLSIVFSGAVLACAGTAMAEEAPPAPIPATPTTATIDSILRDTGAAGVSHSGNDPTEANPSPQRNSCTRFALSGVASGYAYIDDAEVLSTHPVSQSDVGVTCGHWTVDGFLSAGLSGDGTFGNRGYQDEVDVTVTYNNQVRTLIGPVNVELQGGYWFLANFGNFADDIVALHAEAGRPFSIGTTTVTPYVRGTAWIGTGVLPNTELVRGGVRVSVPFATKWTLDTDAGYSWDITDKFGTTYLTVSTSYNLGHGYSLSPGMQFVTNAPTVFRLNLTKTF